MRLWPTSNQTVVPTIVFIDACRAVLGIQNICHFTSRDIAYYPFNFQGYGIVFLITVIL